MTRPTPRFRHMIAELRRRKVFRVVAAYAVIAWAVTEVSATVAPALHLPEWTVTLVVVFAILGFPVAALLAWAYDLTPDGIQATPDTYAADGDAPIVAPLPSSRRARGIAAISLVVILLGITGWAGVRMRSAAEPAPASDLVAVLPFRVSADPSLAYLREGMLDLLAAKLVGDVGPGAIDPRSVMSAWRRAGGDDTVDLSQEDAVALARSLGAGQLLLGEVVSAPPRLVLTARLVDVRDGSTAYRASVEGAADSLPALVDGLAARLLLIQAGEEQHRLESFTSTSLPALTSYLQGQAHFRDGRVEKALDRYLAALELDSTFALAALGAWSAQVWGILRPGTDERIRRLAWASRGRLSERDRLHLVALAGPDYPDASSSARRLEATQRAVNAAPDRPELWYHYGDVLTHDGARLGVADARDEAIAAFQRAADSGPLSAEAIFHLVDLLIEKGDTAAARVHGEAYIAEAGDGDVPRYLRWLLRAASQPHADDPEIAARVAPLSWRVDRWVIQNAQLLGPGFERDADHALQNLRMAAQPQAERASSLRAEIGFLLNAGRPEEAARAMSAADRLLGLQRAGVMHRWRIYAGLYWDGDTAAAAAAAAALARIVATDPGAEPDAIGIRAMELCALEQWRLAHRQIDSTAAVVRRLRTAGPPLHLDDVRHALTCATLLEALHSEATGGRDTAAAAERLAAALAVHLPYYSFDLLFSAAPLVVARLYETAGDFPAALSWLRRRPGAGSTQHVMLSSYLREEGRVAALAGDRSGAARAYHHYLALRSRPEAATAPQVQQVRAGLAGLDR
jgi:tetratricopeptide (TPR) repeat protein